MRVGSDLEAVCRKCGEVWHVVIAKIDGRIVKVECKQCGARHAYRPVPGAGAAPATRRAARRGASSSRTRSRAKPPIVAADPSRPPRPFRTTETYQAGDRVVHATFGEGVVQAVTGTTKIEVLFEVGPKTLVHGRPRR